MHCGMFTSVLDPYPLEASSNPSPLCDNQKCLQTLPNIPWGVELPLLGNLPYIIDKEGDPETSWGFPLWKRKNVLGWILQTKNPTRSRMGQWVAEVGLS